MKAVRLTLISHAQTLAQKVGRFHLEDDPILKPGPEFYTDPAICVITAPERRARETAALFATSAWSSHELHDCDLGHWSGMSLKALQAQDPAGLRAWQQDLSANPHGGESIATLCKRIGNWLEAFKTPGRWLVVTHPFVLRAAMLHVAQCPPTAFHRIDVLPLAKLELSHAGQWRVQLTPMDSARVGVG
ncbi:phosphoglycerate mutase family protein [Pseudomonas capeferrum]|uniref:histidine phosphatase family protein n=1 Tax=Pseudomonas capeferrum TaxID=1495066 RepID=UPI0015E3A22F|nr:phosphoglycerate mutase family protein [Pseudomonas capeferrum]MBA1204537.1 phosphoglycerate mutase family protein [Pseudomonas capeferrum]